MHNTRSWNFSAFWEKCCGHVGLRRPVACLLVVLFLSEMVFEMPSLAVSLLLVKRFHMSPSTQAAYFTIVFIPWSFVGVFGAAADAVPFAATRPLLRYAVIFAVSLLLHGVLLVSLYFLSTGDWGSPSALQSAVFALGVALSTTQCVTAVVLDAVAVHLGLSEDLHSVAADPLPSLPYRVSPAEAAATEDLEDEEVVGEGRPLLLQPLSLAAQRGASDVPQDASQSAPPPSLRARTVFATTSLVAVRTAASLAAAVLVLLGFNKDLAPDAVVLGTAGWCLLLACICCVCAFGAPSPAAVAGASAPLEPRSEQAPPQTSTPAAGAVPLDAAEHAEPAASFLSRGGASWLHAIRGASWLHAIRWLKARSVLLLVIFLLSLSIDPTDGLFTYLLWAPPPCVNDTAPTDPAVDFHAVVPAVDFHAVVPLAPPLSSNSCTPHWWMSDYQSSVQGLFTLSAGLVGCFLYHRAFGGTAFFQGNSVAKLQLSSSLVSMILVPSAVLSGLSLLDLIYTRSPCKSGTFPFAIIVLIATAKALLQRLVTLPSVVLSAVGCDSDTRHHSAATVENIATKFGAFSTVRHLASILSGALSSYVLSALHVGTPPSALVRCGSVTPTPTLSWSASVDAHGPARTRVPLSFTALPDLVVIAALCAPAVAALAVAVLAAMSWLQRPLRFGILDKNVLSVHHSGLN